MGEAPGDCGRGRRRADLQQGMAIADIARQHGRTRGSITSRLVKLGRIDVSAVRTRERGARLVS